MGQKTAARSHLIQTKGETNASTANVKDAVFSDVCVQAMAQIRRKDGNY